jgi:hypothetical protein
MTMRRIALAFATVLALAPLAQANDGFMGLPAGGLTLQQSADIAMLEEDLYLALDEVRVAYKFRNESPNPVTAVVGFPMPGLPVAVNFDAETGYDLDKVTDLRLLDFETRVEGRVVQSKPTVRAFVFARNTDWSRQDRFRFANATDITAELTAAGMPLTFDAQAIRSAWARLPATKKADWLRRGIYARDAGSESPLWFLSTIFVRQQVFPPGRIVSVQHRYKPFPSGFVMSDNHFQYDRELLADNCIDQPTQRAMEQALRSGNGGIGKVLDYILTTANTWKGPIGRFRLTVNKGDSRNLVSFCASGVRKTGPTTFVVEASNFRPDRDLSVLVVQPNTNR